MSDPMSLLPILIRLAIPAEMSLLFEKSKGVRGVATPILAEDSRSPLATCFRCEQVQSGLLIHRLNVRELRVKDPG